jgi:hypothetical protein
MFYTLIGFNTGSLRSLGDMTQLLPDFATYQKLREQIASQKEKQRFLKITVVNSASSGGDQTFKLFDTENTFSSITNGANISVTTDYPGGIDKLTARLKAIGPLFFAGIKYRVSDESVFQNLNLRSLRSAGIDTVVRSVQTEMIDSGEFNEVNNDPKQRIVAVAGEIAYDSGLAGSLPPNSSIEFLFQLTTY